jgi:hypothetical protein
LALFTNGAYFPTAAAMFLMLSSLLIPMRKPTISVAVDEDHTCFVAVDKKKCSIRCYPLLSLTKVTIVDNLCCCFAAAAADKNHDTDDKDDF